MSEKRRRSDRVFNQAVKKVRVPVLHGEDCDGTEQDVATMQNRLQQCPQLLEYRNGNDDPPLISAIVNEHERCVSFLLENGADVEALGSNNSNALVHALFNKRCNISKRNIVNLLIKNGSDPNSVMNINDEAINLPVPVIFLLILTNSFEYVELLLKLGVNPNSVCQYKQQHHMGPGTLSCLCSALIRNHHEIMELLLQFGAKTEDSDITFCAGGSNLICDAIRQGNLKSLKCFLIYNESLVIHRGCLQCEHMSYAKIILLSSANLETKLKMLEMFHKFGYNLWLNQNADETVFSDDDDDELYEEVEEDDDGEKEFYAKLESLRTQPLSLKCLSRLAILRTMGREFPKNSPSLEVPTTLHPFLQFSDVQM